MERAKVGEGMTEGAMNKQERECQKRTRLHIREIIRRELWEDTPREISRGTVTKDCDLAAQKILRYLRRAK